MQMTYNVPVGRAGTSLLDRLVRTRTFVPVSPVPPGCHGRAYRMPGSIQILSLWQVEVGGLTVPADVYRLPSAAVEALGPGSPALNPAGLSHLECRMSRGEVRGWWSQVVGLVQAAGDPPALSLPTGLLQTACWHPEATVWTRSAGHWTLTLTFDVATCWLPGPHDRIVGLDVGVDPLAVLSGSGQHLAVPGVRVPPAGRVLDDLPAGVAAAARRLSRAAVYGVARSRWEGLFAALIPLASVVAVERLDPRSLQDRFRRQCADLAIQDALLSWLPQLACEAGLRLIRVEPSLTSLTCARCLRHGTRQGRVLHCPVHGPVDSHLNAADLVAVLGTAEEVRQHQARAAARRGH